MDTLISPLLDALRACLCAELAADPPCFCGVINGGPNVPADHCSCGKGTKCGKAWVRLDRVFPTTTFPLVDNTPQNCGAKLAATIELGIYRCQPVMDNKGVPPTEADMANAALRSAEDAMAMWRAITCCDALAKRTMVAGAYAPKEVQGGCGGGVWPVTVLLKRMVEPVTP